MPPSVRRHASAELTGTSEPSQTRSRASIPERTMSTRSTRVETRETAPSERGLRELAKLEGTINPEATSLVERLKTSGSDGESAAPAIAMVDRFNIPFEAYSETSFAANDEGQVDYEKVDPSKYKDIFEKPNSFEEAWNHPCPFQRKKWREAIQKEFNKMNGKKVWKKIKRSDME